LIKGQRFVPPAVGSQQIVTYRVTRHYKFFFGKIPFHIFISHTDFLHLGSQPFIGQAGITVLFLDQRGNSSFGGRIQ
jgi:hypothetical protein